MVNNNFSIGFFGIILFFLVISGLYIFIYSSDLIKTSNKEIFNNLQVFIPFIVFTGFFIFLIAAMLVALSIFKKIGGFK